MENNDKKKSLISMISPRKKGKPNREALDRIAQSVNEINHQRAYGEKPEENKENNKVEDNKEDTKVGVEKKEENIMVAENIGDEKVAEENKEETITENAEVEADLVTDLLPPTQKRKKKKQEAVVSDQEITSLAIAKSTAKKVKYASTLMGIDQKAFTTDAIEFYINHCKRTGKLIPIEL